MFTFGTTEITIWTTTGRDKSSGIQLITGLPETSAILDESRSNPTRILGLKDNSFCELEGDALV